MTTEHSYKTLVASTYIIPIHKCKVSWLAIMSVHRISSPGIALFYIYHNETMKGHYSISPLIQEYFYNAPCSDQII